MIFLITGARKGIGRYLAEYYLAKDHTVIGCSRKESDLVHVNYTHFLVDVANQNNIASMLKEIRKRYGYIDVLINNAAIASMNLFLLTPTETAKKIMDTNFFGTMMMCREFARVMRQSKNARIINFSTVARALNLEGEAVYAASKSAVETLTRTIAKELANFNITVNAIGPTPIETDLIRNIPLDKLEKLMSFQAIKRFGKFEDISNLVDFFIKQESDFITGQVVYLGGIS